jgi:hypothetical protein
VTLYPAIVDGERTISAHTPLARRDKLGSSPVTRTILRQFLTASFVLPFFLKMPEIGLNTGLLNTRIVELRKVEIG